MRWTSSKLKVHEGSLKKQLEMLNMFDPFVFTVVPLEKLTAHYVVIVGTPYVRNGCYLICWKDTYKAKDSPSQFTE